MMTAVATLRALPSSPSLRRFLAVAATLTTLTFLSAPADAQTSAVTFTGGSPLSASGQTVGWQFTLSAPVNVTDLGVFDVGGNGLNEAHQVGIWTDGGALVVSGTVPTGNAAPLVGGFRYTSGLSGTSLLAPGTYLVGAAFSVASNDTVITQVSSADLSTPAPVTYIEGRFSGIGTGFSAPTLTNATLQEGFFGGSFRFTLASVSAPEPGTLALLGLGSASPFVGRRLSRAGRRSRK